MKKILGVVICLVVWLYPSYVYAGSLQAKYKVKTKWRQAAEVDFPSCGKYSRFLMESSAGMITHVNEYKEELRTDHSYSYKILERDKNVVRAFESFESSDGGTVVFALNLYFVSHSRTTNLFFSRIVFGKRGQVVCADSMEATARKR